jgi:hypothetical protein
MQTQFNHCGGVMQHRSRKLRNNKRLRLVPLPAKQAQKLPPVENSSPEPFEDVLRKLHIYQNALSQRNRTSNPYLQRQLDSFLNSMIEDIQEMIPALPSPSTLSSQNTSSIQHSTMAVSFGVYGAVVISVHRTVSHMVVDYDLSKLNLEFCAIAGTRQAIEAIVLEFVEAIHTGYITIQQNRVLNGFAELQNRQIALIQAGGVA